MEMTVGWNYRCSSCNAIFMCSLPVERLDWCPCCGGNVKWVEQGVVTVQDIIDTELSFRRMS